MITPEVLARIEAKTEQVTSGCWEWRGYRDPAGYGRYTVDHRSRLVHRLMYEVARGPVPVGLVIDHLCRVRHCCNPAHLEAVPHRVNTLRGEGPAARAWETACLRGHPKTPENIIVYPSGSRDCRPCCTIRARARGLAQKEARRARVEERAGRCKHGHAFDEANTYRYERDGKPNRSCRTCARVRTSERRARIAAERMETAHARRLARLAVERIQQIEAMRARGLAVRA